MTATAQLLDSSYYYSIYLRDTLTFSFRSFAHLQYVTLSIRLLQEESNEKELLAPLLFIS